MSNKTRNKKSKKILPRARIFFLMLFFIIALSCVGILRVLTIKVKNSSDYEKNAIENQINKVTDKIVTANRGSILDRNNQPLAISSKVFNVALDIRVISKQKQETIENIVSKVAEILELDANELSSYFVKDESGNLQPEYDTNWKIVKKEVPYAIGKKLEAENLTGVHLETDSQRTYPHNNLAAQTIGFIMGDTSWGLESSYNETMTGTPGRIYRASENYSSIVTKDIDPIDGNTIITTLDYTLQQYAEDIIKDTYNSLTPNYTPEAISFILMDPNTGEILVMAQYPNFDVNNPNNISLLEDFTYKEEFENLTTEEQLTIKNSIWKNLSISDAFEPGSTFKPIVVAAALEEGLITEDETFYCPGYRQVGDYVIRCHKRDGHGNLNLTEALEKSCNIAMLDLADKLGRELFYNYQKEFGFGYKTGIDLYGEIDASSFILPIEKLNVTELATSSFGQTFIATPIQIITGFAATINGGNIVKPYIVSQIIDEDGNIVKENSPEIVRKVISKDTSDFLKIAMISTLGEGGTASKANIPGYSIGGKTGTAQQGVRSEDIYTLSFAAYLPAEDPQYLALAVIHKPNDYINAPSGEVSPVPMMKEFLQKLIDYKSIPPSTNEIVVDDIITTNEMILKDFSNTSLKNTIKELNNMGIDFQLVGGSGDTVVKQIPAANAKITKDTKVLLYIESKNEDSELVAIPDVKGLSVDIATNLIKELGFEVIVEETVSDNTNISSEENIQDEIYDIFELVDESNTINEISKEVYFQMPESGIFIEKGSIIKIKAK